MKTKYDGHTPGPWHSAAERIRTRAGYFHSETTEVGYAFRSKEKMHLGEAEANLALLTAAPALLAALTKIVEADTRANTAARIGTSSECYSAEEQIHAAIDEARKLIQGEAR
jgi:hypothetical protein